MLGVLRRACTPGRLWCLGPRETDDRVLPGVRQRQGDPWSCRGQVGWLRGPLPGGRSGTSGLDLAAERRPGGPPSRATCARSFVAPRRHGQRRTGCGTQSFASGRRVAGPRQRRPPPAYQPCLGRVMTDHLGRWVGIAVLGLVGLVAVIAAAGGDALGAVLGGPGPTPVGGSTSAIPPDYLALYQQAATNCPGLSWAVLAAIGTIESGNGTSN